MFRATAKACASTWGRGRLNLVWNSAASWALVSPVRLPVPAPYRLGKLVASQADNAIEAEPPLKLSISAWPAWLFQKLMVPVTPGGTPNPRLVTVAVPLVVA